jgi:dTDP-4-amino-4,6-dideoxygalactose transaminase
MDAAKEKLSRQVQEDPEPIPMVDLKAQFEQVRDEAERVVIEVLASARYINGPNVQAFEGELAGYCGTKHAVGTASGTDALELALRAFGIGPGDEVITTPFTFAASIEAIYLAGASPVFADIDPETFNIDPSKIPGRITKRTKAMIAVDLYGHVARMNEITEIARAHDLNVIEDAAQAIGATHNGKRAGGLGDVGVLSFYPSKNLGACGDAGALVTDDDDLCERLKLLRDHGSRGGYIHETLGRNSRLDELQAAILRVKLRRLDGWIEARRRLAASYDDLLPGSGVQIPEVAPECRHNYYLYTIRAERRDALKEYLARQRIASVVYYPVPMHLQEAFAEARGKAGDFPEAERASREVLSLPCAPELSPAQIERVAAAIGGFYSRP